MNRKIRDIRSLQRTLGKVEGFSEQESKQLVQELLSEIRRDPLSSWTNTGYVDLWSKTYNYKNSMVVILTQLREPEVPITVYFHNNLRGSTTVFKVELEDLPTLITEVS